MSDDDLAKLAERALTDPETLKTDEIRKLAQAVLDSREPWSRAHYPADATPLRHEDDLQEGEAD